MRMKRQISQKLLLLHLSSYHSPIMSQILGIHRERHYDEGEGDDVQFHVELRRVSSNWVSAIISSNLSQIQSFCSCKQDGKPIKWTCGRDMAKHVLP